MTASQYKNIIEWTYRLNSDIADWDDLKQIRFVLDRLGVAFPQGTLAQSLPVLESASFLGWTPSNCEDAGAFANVGVPTIALNAERIYMIMPTEQTPSLSFEAFTLPSGAPMRSTDELCKDQLSDMAFFTYSYRHTLKK